MAAFNFPVYLEPLSENHPLARFFDLPPGSPNRAIKMLFRTVILHAIYDGLKGCPEARRWLLTPSEDLHHVSDLANLCPHWVRCTSRDILAKKHTMPAYRVWRYLWADMQQKGL